jgi:hypothetical protein
VLQWRRLMSKRLTYLAIALAGGAAGAALGLLAAPRPGEQTRRQLASWLGAEVDRLSPMPPAHEPFDLIYYNEGADLLADVVNL